MTKAIAVENSQLAHVVAVAKASSPENGLRDAALLLCGFGNGMKPAELKQLRVNDYLSYDDEPLAEMVVRPERAFNGRARLAPYAGVNKKQTIAIDEHMANRLLRGHRITGRLTAYRGLDPQSDLFVSGLTC